jgi:hypothetical protein
MQTNHTDGPWVAERVTDEPGHEDELAINTPEGICVARVWPVGEDFDCEDGAGPNQTTNARLIAAAPDLLEACNAAMDALDMMIDGMDVDRAIEETGCTARLAEARAKVRGVTI